MTEGSSPAAPAAGSTQRLAILLAMAMFVLVVDTSLMNVSIAVVVRDLDTTVSGVQSAIALEALVSAAFILIGSKVGDLIGRRRAYVLGLLGYAVGALSMAFAQGLTAIIVFWAVVGGFLLEVVIIAVVVSGIRLVRDVPYTGPRHIDLVGAVLSILAMGGIVLSILVWQEGGESVGALLAIGAIALAGLAWWLVRRARQQKPTLLDPDLFRSKVFRLGITGQMLQQIALGGTMIALPIYLQMVLEYNAMEAGLSLAPLSLTMFGMAILAGRRAGGARARSSGWGSCSSPWAC
jgi:MFS family permease